MFEAHFFLRMKEIWKDIQGYEGLYQVSNLGRVRSFSDKKKGDFLSLKRQDRNGYTYICLCVGDVRKYKKVHRLVAEAFIPNPDNLSCINHKDECRTNNHVDNLEWCTPKYNVNYGTGIERAKESRRKNKSCFKPVYAFKDGELVAEYDSITDAARQMGVGKTCIWLCCTGVNKSACGYQWSYEPICPVVEYVEQRKPVYCYTIEGEFVGRYNSINEAARQTGALRANIQKCFSGELKKTHGFRFSLGPITQPLPTHQSQPE